MPARKLLPDFAFETRAHARGLSRVAGVDEVGRGPLAGPVLAAAVILDPARIPDGLDDSKRLSPARRRALCAQVLVSAEVGTGMATVAEIDRLNILRASHLAMQRAVEALSAAPDLLLIDGNRRPPGLTIQAECLVAGDRRSASIAAASIVAKVARDALMLDLAQQFPGYGWETNMGYGAPAHLRALATLGPTPHHRSTFAPVHKILCRPTHPTS